MSNYTLQDLIDRWKQEKATPEQAIGQMLQWLRIHDERLRELERARREAAPPNSPPSKTTSRNTIG